MTRPSFRVIAFTLFCFCLAAIAWSGMRWAERLPAKIALAGQAALEKKALELRARFFAMADFQPRLRVNQKVIAETTSAIAEVAVLEKDIEVQREFIHTWAGSTKTLRLRGKYRIKAGFNLLDRFEIQIQRGQSRIALPPASVLSVEQKELHVEALENGYWNPISADDLQTSISALQAQARAQSGDLLRDAEKTFAGRLQTIGGPTLEIIPVAP